MNDAERFKDVEPLLVPARAANSKSTGPVAEFRGLLPTVAPNREKSSNASDMDPKILSWADLSEDPTADASVVRVDNQLVLQTRKYVRRYYGGTMRCDDPACRTTTRHMRSLDRGRGRACVIPGCRGTMYPTYSAKQLYTQLQYFEGLVDVPRAERKKRQEAKSAEMAAATDAPKKIGDAELPSAKDAIREDLEMLKDNVHGTLSQSAYNWVKPDLWKSVFSS